MSKQILSEIHSIKAELKELHKSMFIKMITEGVDDPGILKCIFLAGGPGCFEADTLVHTVDGYKKISEMSNKDNVYTLNEKTGETEIKPVILTHVYNTHTDDLLELEFEGGIVVRCTENHLFYDDGKWVAAKDLVVE